VNPKPEFEEDLIYHIAAQAEWQRALEAGEYRADTLESEGFIHASTRKQVVDTANSFYHGKDGLVLLEIEVKALPVEVRYELAPNGGRYPHIFGPIFPQAVTRVMPFPPDAEGNFHWPDPDTE
jgi:uncharacterized protein (DUF952 family)